MREKNSTVVAEKTFFTVMYATNSNFVTNGTNKNEVGCDEIYLECIIIK